jgi:hypothetical protein
VQYNVAAGVIPALPNALKGCMEIIQEAAWDQPFAAACNRVSGFAAEERVTGWTP